MKNKKTWETNHEERASLRMALYEDLKENPKKTYSQLGKEFGVNASEAKLLVIEYCKILNIESPIESVIRNTHRKEMSSERVGEYLTVDGREALILKEMERTFVVRFLDDNESEVILKSDMSITRLKRLRV